MLNQYSASWQPGQIQVYPSQGNFLLMPNVSGLNSYENAMHYLQQMKENRWLDSNTRMISHFFVLANVEWKENAYFKLMIEASDTGFVTKYLNINMFSLQADNANLKNFSLFCWVLLALVVLVLGWKCIKKMYGDVSLLMQFWFLHRVVFVCFSLAAVILYLTYSQKLKAKTSDGFLYDTDKIDDYLRLIENGKQLISISIFLVVLRVNIISPFQNPTVIIHSLRFLRIHKLYQKIIRL